MEASATSHHEIFDVTDLDLAKAESERTQDAMVSLCMALGDTPSEEKKREHEAAVDAFLRARMEQDREWAKVHQPCPSRLSVSGVLCDLPKESKEERDAFWAPFRARVAAQDAAQDAAAEVGKKRKA